MKTLRKYFPTYEQHCNRKAGTLCLYVKTAENAHRGATEQFRFMKSEIGNMRIKKLRIINYRSILDETLDCDNLTILVGRNGAGKSSFLQALRLFMETASSPSTEDFYNHDPINKIQVEVTFSDLNAEEQTEFQSYLEAGCLEVQRKFPGGEYYGRANGCEELESIRDRLRQKAKVSEVAQELKKLVESGKYPGMNAVSRAIEEELDRWERDNPARCRPFFRAGLFQGPTNIAGGKMRNRTHFVYVAPVREAEADASGGGSKVLWRHWLAH